MTVTRATRPLAALALIAATLTASAAPPAAKKVRQFRGFSMQLIDPDGADDVVKEIDKLADMGCSSINFVVSAYQKDVHATNIHIPWDKMQKPTDIERILKHAKSKHMLVMLMPIVLLESAGSKEWRGVIAPNDWDAWFESYTNYITTMARLAKKCDADVLLVGSELLSTETFKDRWTHVIGEVRKVFKAQPARPGRPAEPEKPIKLAYSANWDHFHVVTFWDQLDYIAMNNYNELASKPGVPLDELIKKWDPIKENILAFVKKQNKPFFFSETGWHNVQNTIKEPWNYVAEGPIDLDEQKRAFQSFVKAWENVTTDQFMGAFVWEWRANVDGATHHGTYCLQNTPALEVVREWMKGAEWK